MKKIKIKIAGAQGAGKTSLLNVISRALTDLGIKHKVDNDELDPGRPTFRIADFVKKNNVEITIETTNEE